MYAHTFAIRAAPENLEAIVAFYRDTMGPTISRLPGFRRLTLLVDPARGACLATSYWATEGELAGFQRCPVCSELLAHLETIARPLPLLTKYAVAVEIVAASVEPLNPWANAAGRAGTDGDDAIRPSPFGWLDAEQRCARPAASRPLAPAPAAAPPPAPGPTAPPAARSASPPPSGRSPSPA